MSYYNQWFLFFFFSYHFHAIDEPDMAELRLSNMSLVKVIEAALQPLSPFAFVSPIVFQKTLTKNIDFGWIITTILFCLSWLMFLHYLEPFYGYIAIYFFVIVFFTFSINLVCLFVFLHICLFTYYSDTDLIMHYWDCSVPVTILDIPVNFDPFVKLYNTDNSQNTIHCPMKKFILMFEASTNKKMDIHIKIRGKNI